MPMLAVLLFAASLFPQEEVRSAPLPDPYTPGSGSPLIDVLGYELDLALLPRYAHLEGIATVHFQLQESTSSFSLDLHHDLNVEMVLLNGVSSSFKHSRDDKLNLHFKSKTSAGTSHSIEIHYGGDLPQEPILGDVVGLVSDGFGLVAYMEPDGAHHWFPCNDHPSDKATYEMNVRVPWGDSVGGIGAFQGFAFQNAGWSNWSWSTQHDAATYLAALAVGKYSILRTAVPESDPPLYIWNFVEPRDRKQAEKVFDDTASMVQLFSKLFGPYPFEKYGHALSRKWLGGMEDQTLTILGREEALAGDETLIAHELAHQWFGDWVSPRSWSDLWLNEGWATWSEYLWVRTQNKRRSEALIRTWRRSTLQIARNDFPHTLAKPKLTDPFDYRVVYNKGGMVLHILAQYLGEDRFLPAVRHWLAARADGSYSSEDFQATLEKELKVDLEPFFKAWVHNNGIPKIKILRSAEPIEDGKWRIHLQAEQKQERPWNPIVVTVLLRDTDGEQEKEVTLRFDSPKAELEFELAFQPKQLIPDPDRLLPVLILP